MFLTLSKILDLFLSPLTWALLLMAAALVVRRRRGLADALGGLALVILLVFSSEPVAQRLMRFAERSAPRTYQPHMFYDAIIVLGGVIDPGASRAAGSPQVNGAADRIIQAAELLRSGHARNALVSGGLIRPQPGEPSEAEQIATRLREWGIAPDRIYLETRSRNTRENVVESARVIAAQGWRRMLLITSAVHMPRALGCFRAVGLTPDTLPVNFRASDGHGESWLPRADTLDMSAVALREMAGRLVYWAMGYSKP